VSVPASVCIRRLLQKDFHCLRRFLCCRKKCRRTCLHRAEQKKNFWQSSTVDCSQWSANVNGQ